MFNRIIEKLIFKEAIRSLGLRICNLRDLHFAGRKQRYRYLTKKEEITQYHFLDFCLFNRFRRCIFNLLTTIF